MKKIILLHHVSGLGGGTKSLFDVAMMLKETYQVLLAVPNGSREIVEQAEVLGLDIYEIKAPIPSINIYSGRPSYLSRYFWNTLFRFKQVKVLVDELMSLEPDCIFYNTSVIAPIAKFIPEQVINIGIVRETFTKNPLNKIFKAIYENHFAGVAYIAAHEKDYLALSRPHQLVVPDCLDPNDIKRLDAGDVRQKHQLAKERFVGLFMGGTIQIKGLDVLLKAIEQLDDDSLFFVAGKVDQSLLSWSHLLKHAYQLSYVQFLLSVKKRLHKLMVADKVRLTGFTQGIAEYMTMANVIVFPSTAAHQPRPAIEAGHFSKPVILSDYEATQEYFQDGYNALTFEPKNASDLARKLTLLKNDVALQARLGANNYRASEEWHHYSKTQDELNQFFEAILK